MVFNHHSQTWRGCVYGNGFEIVTNETFAEVVKSFSRGSVFDKVMKKWEGYK